MVCKNQLAEPEGIFVLHTRTPKFIARAVKTDSLTLLELQKQHNCIVNGITYNIGAQTRVNDQLWALFVIDLYDSIDIDLNAIGSGGLMSRMGDWFHAYLKNNTEL